MVRLGNNSDCPYTNTYETHTHSHMKRSYEIKTVLKKLKTFLCLIVCGKRSTKNRLKRLKNIFEKKFAALMSSLLDGDSTVLCLYSALCSPLPSPLLSRVNIIHLFLVKIT